MKRRLCLCLALVLIFMCGCAGEAPETTPTTTIPSTAPTTEPTTEPATEPSTEPATQPPTEPPVLYRHPLTGEPLDAPMTARPFAVMMNNYKSALPIHGIGQADIVYEAVTEGGMTRCMGLFTNLADVKELGSLRSARRHFVSLALSYDAIYVHYGQSSVPGTDVGAKEYMEITGINHMDGTRRGYAYFYESKDRLNAGYNKGDECHFLVGKRAIDYAKDNGFPLHRDEPLDYGLTFEDELSAGGTPISELTAYFTKNGKYTRFKYDPDTQTFLSFQFGQKNIDGTTGEQLAFRNVFVIKAPSKQYSERQLMQIDLEGEGTGYYARDGKLFPIQWSREDAYSPFVYTYEDGTPLTLGVGKSYFVIVPTNATVKYE